MRKSRTFLEEKLLKIVAVKKRIKKCRKLLDTQEKAVQKLVELLDGIIIDPVRGVILTPKKKRQRAELQKIK
ncbi:MAG: hypothetical protein AAB362_02590 [Patescibacteria group bacterium]